LDLTRNVGLRVLVSSGLCVVPIRGETEAFTPEFAARIQDDDGLE